MDEWTRRGIGFFNNKDYEKAIREFSEAITRNPGDAKIYNFRGMAYFYDGQYREAIADHEKALELGLDNADLRKRLEVARHKVSRPGPPGEREITQRERVIGFVEQAIEKHNQNPNEPNDISIYSNEDGPANGHPETPPSHWLWFQTKSMDNLLNIPQGERQGYYYRYWFRATDSGTMIWSFSLVCEHANADMRSIMKSIADKSIEMHTCSNPRCVARILANKGTIINTQRCDISSPESAKMALGDFLQWEQELCEALAKKQ
jgi:tetratricopeptide (TPR) repeat protein